MHQVGNEYITIVHHIEWNTIWAMWMWGKYFWQLL